MEAAEDAWEPGEDDAWESGEDDAEVVGMIEGYARTGPVLLNPGEVVEVFAGGERQTPRSWSTFWCNVVTRTGAVHRFAGREAEKVYDALKGWPGTIATGT